MALRPCVLGLLRAGFLRGALWVSVGCFGSPGGAFVVPGNLEPVRAANQQSRNGSRSHGLAFLLKWGGLFIFSFLAPPAHCSSPTFPSLLNWYMMVAPFASPVHVGEFRHSQLHGEPSSGVLQENRKGLPLTPEKTVCWSNWFISS